MEPLKIFSMAQWDWAGCGYFLSEAINACTPHHCRAFKTHPSTLGFPYEYRGLNVDEGLTPHRFRLLWDWADVIHIHDAPGVKSYDKLPPKPTVVTYHGTRYRGAPQVYAKLLRKHRWIGTVSTTDLTLFGLPWMPDTRPDLSEFYDPPDKFTVAHAPTKRVYKGTEQVIEACKKLDVPLVLVEGKTWEECVRLKGRAHVLADQFTFGHGCNGIEAWMTGQAVVGDADPEVLRLFRERAGELPFLCSSSSLVDALARLRDDDPFRQEMVEKGAAYAQRYHSGAAVGRIALGFYRQAIEMCKRAPRTDRKAKRVKRKAPRMPAAQPKEKVLLVRYAGRGSSKQTWFPENGTGLRYEFGGNKPECYVYESDLPWFLAQKDKKGNPLFVLIEEEGS